MWDGWGGGPGRRLPPQGRKISQNDYTNIHCCLPPAAYRVAYGLRQSRGAATPQTTAPHTRQYQTFIYEFLYELVLCGMGGAGGPGGGCPPRVVRSPRTIILSFTAAYRLLPTACCLLPLQRASATAYRLLLAASYRASATQALQRHADQQPEQDEHHRRSACGWPGKV